MALFGVGGVLTEHTGDVDQVVTLAEVKAKDSSYSVDPNMRAAVLKHATGGVAAQLISRAEIIKFVSQRGAKALSEIAANPADQEEEASA